MIGQKIRSRWTDGRRIGRGGFTLIELLVVIAIIALLISILLPSLSGARDSARDEICKSNMKQIGYAIQMYLDGQKAPVWPNLNFGSIPVSDRPEELQTNSNATVITQAFFCHWFMGYALEEYLGDNLRNGAYKCPRAFGPTSVKDPTVRQYLESGFRLFLDPGDPDYTRSAAQTPASIRRYTEYWFNDNVFFQNGRATNRPYNTIKFPDEFVWMADAYDEVPRHGGKTRTERGNIAGNDVIRRINVLHLLRGDLRVDAMPLVKAIDGRDRYGNPGPFYVWGGVR